MLTSQRGVGMSGQPGNALPDQNIARRPRTTHLQLTLPLHSDPLTPLPAIRVALGRGWNQTPTSTAAATRAACSAARRAAASKIRVCTATSPWMYTCGRETNC